MSIHARLWIALSILMLLADFVLFIIGAPNTRFGLTGALCAAIGSVHLRLDRMDRLALDLCTLARSHLKAIDRQTDVHKGRR
jgi:hypothetical protein